MMEMMVVTYQVGARQWPAGQREGEPWAEGRGGRTPKGGQEDGDGSPGSGWAAPTRTPRLGARVGELG